MLSMLGNRGGPRSPQQPRASLILSEALRLVGQGALTPERHMGSKPNHTVAVGKVIAIPRNDLDKEVTGGKANPSLTEGEEVPLLKL